MLSQKISFWFVLVYFFCRSADPCRINGLYPIKSVDGGLVNTIQEKKIACSIGALFALVGCVCVWHRFFRKKKNAKVSEDLDKINEEIKYLAHACLYVLHQSNLEDEERIMAVPVNFLSTKEKDVHAFFIDYIAQKVADEAMDKQARALFFEEQTKKLLAGKNLTPQDERRYLVIAYFLAENDSIWNKKVVYSDPLEGVPPIEKSVDAVCKEHYSEEAIKKRWPNDPEELLPRLNYFTQATKKRFIEVLQASGAFGWWNLLNTILDKI